MSKFLKYFLFILVLVTASGFTALQVLKPRLNRFIKQALNSAVDANVDYGDADISLFRAFPAVSLSCNDLQVLDKNFSSPDTLATAERFSVAFDPFSVFSGEMKIASLKVERPTIHIRIDSAGLNNWDVFSSADQSKSSAELSGFNLLFRDFRIKDGYIAFYDSTKGNSFLVEGFNYEMKGRLSGRSSTLRTSTVMDSLSVTIGGMPLLKKTRASFTAEIAADLENRKFELKDNRLALNELGIILDGSVSLLDEAVNTDLDFRADKVELKELLSLFPVLYESNYKKLDARGGVKLAGHVKGLYRKDQLPAFELALDVTEGSFGYEGVPVRAEEISFSSNVMNPGGDADKTTLSIPELTLRINGKPVVMKLDVKTPVSDPYIDAAINGSLNLSDFQKIYPLKDLKLSGELRSNVVVKGNLSAFKTGLSGVQRTEAYGSIVAKGLKVSSEKFTPDIVISSAQLNLSPGYINLVDLQSRAGKSDFSASGRLENYIPFMLKKGDLRGSLDVRSGFVQLDEFRNLEEKQQALLLPAHVSMRFNGVFNRVAFGDMQFEGAKGLLVLDDEKLDFRDISAESLGGKVTINGYYATKGGITDTDFSITAAEMNIVRSYKAIKLLETVAPVAEYARGDVSANLSMSSRFDENFNPVLETLTGKGRIGTKGLVIEEFPPIKKLALLLDVQALDTLRIPEAAIDFAIDNGLVTTQPFSFTVNDIIVKASGVTGFDKSLDWKIGLQIPKKYIGKAGIKTISGLLQKLSLENKGFSLPDTVIVDAALRGSVTNPQIGLDAGRTAERMVSRIKERVTEKLTGELRDRLLPGSGGDSTDVEGGSVTDLLKKGAGEILFTKKQQTVEDSVAGEDTTKGKKGLPAIIGNILTPQEQRRVEQPKDVEAEKSPGVVADSTGIEQPQDSTSQSRPGGDSAGKQNILDLIR